ncbi:MAG: ABC transporter permease [Oscillospiraceae bacterium]|nr:ABC transporter permease [Oscillospiraceae bacterium]
MLFFAELKRVLLNKKMLAAIFILLTLSLLLSWFQVDNNIRQKYGETEYKNYCEKWQGALTDAKKHEIEYERFIIDTTLAARQENELFFEQGKLSLEEYEDYLRAYFYADRNVAGFNRFYEQYLRVLNHSEDCDSTQPMLIYDSYWNELFTQYPSVLLLTLFGFVIVPYVTGDYTSDMWRIIKVAQKGMTKLVLIRISAVLVFCVTVQLLFSFTMFVFFEKMYILPGHGFSIQSIEIFQYQALSLSIIGYYIVLSMMRLVFSLVLCVLIYSLSLLIKNLIAAVGAVLSVFLLPFASQNFAPWLFLYSPLSVMSTIDILAHQSTHYILFITLIIYSIISGLVFFVAVRKL